MPYIYEKREKAEKYNVNKDDTLRSIAQEYAQKGGAFADLDWEILALYNWGTKERQEVYRAIVETIGCAEAYPGDVSKFKLDPALGPDGADKTMLIPKIWKATDLALDKSYTVKIKKQLPMPAIAITKLDKWFIPGDQTCDIDYDLEGDKERADKVDLNVYASNYCKASAANEGEFLKYTYESLDIPVFQKIGSLKAESRNNKISYRDWKGESEAADGVLKKRGDKRFINVANSPYTVLLRYYKDDADKDARINLAPFWPEFKDAAVVDKSLSIKWKVEKCTRLKHGQLIIWDKTDKPVFSRILSQKDLEADKDQEFNWQDNGGKEIVKEENMPYRVQIQAHTGIDDNQGVALAAMHTEVRLFVHADIGTQPEEPVKEPQCLELAIAPFLPYRDKEKEKPAIGADKWYKLKLAEGGFHPGPVGDDATGTEFTLALKEFQRSYPENSSSPYKRLKADGSKSDKTKDALNNLAQNARLMFGDPDKLEDCKPEKINGLLSNKDESMIVWVEDRHCYTEGAWKPSPAQFTTQYYDMENYRGDMIVNDGRVEKDKQSNARPWIPVEIRMALLSKTQSLDIKSNLPKVTDAMRNAIGPIRVDWTFNELAPDFEIIPLGNEKDVAKITLSGPPSGGTFKLTYDGNTTAAIAHNASASTIETALKGLTKIAADDEKKKRVSVTGPAGGPWIVNFESGFSGPDVTTITADGSSLTDGNAAVTSEKIKITRARKFVEEIMTKESPDGTAKKEGKKLYTNCLEKINGNDSGGIRPADITKYYKAPFGLDKTGSLLPWLAHDDSTEKVICTFVHDDLGQDEGKLYPDFTGKAGIYLNPSRIAGDGYQFRAQVSFRKLPGDDAANHPNRDVLEKRYPKLPQAHTAKMRIWRKTAFRGYAGWVKNVEAKWEEAMDNAAAFYKPAYVHFVHEGPDPKKHQQFEVKGVNKLVTEDEYKKLIEKQLQGSPYDSIRTDAKLTEGYVWPFLHKPHYGIKRRPGDLKSFADWLYGTIEETSWDLYSKELIHLVITKIESKHGRMRGHVIAEFNSSPPLQLCEYHCSDCGDKISEVVNDPVSGAAHPTTGIEITYRQEGLQCRTHGGTGCTGTYERKRRRVIDDGIPLCAIGQPLGGCWLYTPRNPETWAHEVGHHRHLQHAQAYANKNVIAPGGQVKQHDSATHPHMTASSLSAFQKAWDRFCIMSYDKGASRCFCGKCLLKNRGWAVEDIKNPDSALHD